MFFMLGTWPFLMVIGVIVFAMMYASEYKENGVAAFFVLLAGVAFLQWGVEDFSLYETVAANAMDVAAYAVGYFIIGAAWMLVKWFIYCNRLRNIAKDYRENFDALTAAKKGVGFADYLTSYSTPYPAMTYPPELSNYKRDLGIWATYWPLSIVWTLFNDPFRWMVNAMYRHFGKGIQHLTNKMFKDI